MNKPNPGRTTGLVRLRNVTKEDLPIFFVHQQDPAACYMAAFTSKDPADREAFDAHWGRLLADEAIVKKTILVEGQVVGHVAAFEQSGEMEVTYWIGRDHWEQGYTSSSLALLLQEVDRRPIFARAAKDNVASIRVLEKCGFSLVGEDRGYANAREKITEEYIFRLDT